MTESEIETKATRKQRKTIATAVAAIVTRRSAEKEKTMPKKIETKTSDAGDAAPKRRGRPPKVKPLELEVASAMPELSTDPAPAMPTVKRVRTAKVPYIPPEELSTDRAVDRSSKSLATPMPDLSAGLTPAMPVAAPAADAWGEAAVEEARKGGDAVVKFLGEDNPYAKMKADELLDAAEAIDRKARTAERLKTREDILKAAAAAKLTPVKETALLRILVQRTDAAAKAVEEEFAAIVTEFAKIGAPSAEELAKQRAEEDAKLAAERAAEAAELEGEVLPLAKDPKLMEKMVAFAHENGIVGEEAGIVATALTIMSRLIRRKAMSMLRRGAPSGGKSYVVETMLLMFEDGVDYHMFSDGSPKSIAYFGGIENTKVFENTVIYIPEAASIAPKRGEEDGRSLCLRNLLSEGRFSYTTVQTQDEGPPVAMTFVKTGPIAVVMTSARDNVEAELLTRILVSDADEGAAQTSRVVKATVERATRGRTKITSGTTLDMWKKLQRWLRLGGPYEVQVPKALADAIAAGYAEVQQAGGIPLRVRRDVMSILSAVYASAILHKAQRRIAEDGAIIADIADYAVAFEAFADSLRSLYKPGTGITTVRLVEAVEKLIVEEAAKAAEARQQRMKDEVLTEAQHDAKYPFSEASDSVQASYKKLGAAMGLSTTSTVGQRVEAAVSEGVIEAIETGRGGRSGARVYRVLVPSKVLKSPTRRVPVVPTPQRVAELMAEPSEAQRIVEAADKAAKAVQAEGMAHEDDDEEAGA